MDVTGRDNLIITKALAYAIGAIERLPPEWQERSDLADMRRLLQRRAGPDAERFHLPAARAHLERRGIQPDGTGGIELAARDGDSNVVERLP